MKRICVNYASNSGARTEYVESALQLGELLAKKEIELVYGGAEVGLMGAVASATMKNGLTKTDKTQPRQFSQRKKPPPPPPLCILIL